MNQTMTTTNILLAAFQAAYPALSFETVTKVETVHADDSEYAETLIGVAVNDVLIVDPFVSSCGRFDVEPEEAYGLCAALAKQLVAHNHTPATTSSTPAP